MSQETMPPSDTDNEVVIPLPRVVSLIERLPHQPEHGPQFRVDAELLFERLDSFPEADVVLGSQILIVVLEENEQLPTTQDVVTLTHYAEEMKALRVELLANPRKAEQQRIKDRLKKLNILGTTISEAMVENAQSEAERIRQERTLVIDSIRAVQHSFDNEYLRRDKDNNLTNRVDLDKIETLYEETDPFVESDEFLRLAHELRQRAHNDRERLFALKFERFVRYMFAFSQLRGEGEDSLDESE